MTTTGPTASEQARAQCDAINECVLSLAADRGLSIAALAREGDLNANTLRRHLKPGGAMRLSELVRIASVFGIGPTELVEAAGRPKPGASER